MSYPNIREIAASIASHDQLFADGRIITNILPHTDPESVILEDRDNVQSVHAKADLKPEDFCAY